MKRLLGVTEMRKLLESADDVYEIVDTINQRAVTYAFKVTMGVIEREANITSKKLSDRIKVTKKLKTKSNTFIKI